MKVGFIGCGNMGGALIKAAAKSIDVNNIYVYDRSREKADALADALGVISAGKDGVIAETNYIFLGVKPQVLKNAIEEIRDTLKARQDRFVIVSMAAGVKISTIISAFFGFDLPIIRIMPNTPASVGEGMILYDTNGLVSNEEKEEFLKILSKAGKLDCLPEHLIDAGCALSGCGPAFVDLFAEALADAGVKCGLPRDKALLYAAQTLLGASKLMLETGAHPAVLKDAVCSPGGSTIEGVHMLEMNGFRGDVMDAVCASFEKTKELG
ncbi:MAG: pyrroline-5-carboxylate reductase [Clostridia bacterium]|nr:pyrroline-5-carboxylate reductase [Clostridia bacterium]